MVTNNFQIEIKNIMREKINIGMVEDVILNYMRNADFDRIINDKLEDTISDQLDDYLDDIIGEAVDEAVSIALSEIFE